MASTLDSLAVHTLRFLCADMVQKANSGHPGLPMGAADTIYALYTRHLSYNPQNPAWFDRDRFVLSAGHGSALLYGILHLTGYNVSLDELKKFRQIGSLTPGHPERGHTPGVEATTGPLGQGIANAVGMAIAEAHLSVKFNKPGHDVIDHFTYTLSGDGCLMEGIAYEACSLAGHLGLGKLIVLFDDNHISLAASTALSYSENTKARFESMGWQVIVVGNGNDCDAVDAAIAEGKSDTKRPTLIMVRTTIGFGAPTKAGSYESHGAPLGEAELQGAKANLGFPTEPSFHLPADALAHYRTALARGAKIESEWTTKFDAYSKAFPAEAKELSRLMSGKLPDGWDAKLPAFPADEKGIATRKAGESILQELAKSLPELIGGSADLNPSTFTWLKGLGDFENPDFSKDGVIGAIGSAWGYDGRNIHFGVREHAMAGIVNGIECHGGAISYGSTFFVFADYMRPSIRLSSLSNLGAVWVFTHDSIGVGEDGPTHQPIEHLASLRAIPGLSVIRPADANETVEAWKIAIERRNSPTALVLSRQNLPVFDRTVFSDAKQLRKGAYILRDFGTGQPDLIIMASGSEVTLAAKAAQALSAQQGLSAESPYTIRVVSFPSWDLFAAQDQSYRDSVLPPNVKARLAIEAGISLGWEKWIGHNGDILSIEGFGISAPANDVFSHFGFNVETVIEKAKNVIGKKG